MGAWVVTGTARDHLFTFCRIGDMRICLFDFLKQPIGVNDGVLLVCSRGLIGFHPLAPAGSLRPCHQFLPLPASVIQVSVIPNAVW
jgi:hypothetical protein